MPPLDEMKLYTVRRPAGWDTPAKLRAVASELARETEPAGIRWLRSLITLEPDGSLVMICLYRAANAEQVLEHARRAGLPAWEIAEVDRPPAVHAEPVVFSIAA